MQSQIIYIYVYISGAEEMIFQWHASVDFFW